jgi:hypothetical protein
MTQLQKNQEKLERNPWGDLVVDCLSEQTVRLPSRQDSNSELHSKNMESQESRAGGWGRERERETQRIENNKGLCHTVTLPYTLKSILRKKKKYGNSNISPCKNILFKKIL